MSEPESPSEYISSILRYLTQLDTNTEEFSQTLSSILHSRDYSDFVSSLHGQELIAFIDFLDRALDASLGHPDLYQKCLRSLRRLCGQTGQFPTSHIISTGLAKTSENAVAPGGFADVWIGSFQELPVAIKSLRIYGTDEMTKVRKRLCKEAVIWKRLSHPNVLPFLGVYTTESELWMISEWMPHGNLVQYLKSHPEGDRLEFLLDVAKGLEYLHSSHVLHTNLKGANIVVDATGHARLADFGLAVITSESLSANASTPGDSRGTARWMAPELLDPSLPDPDAARPTTASDIYAFAMVAIEIFSGHVPFHGIRTESAIFKALWGARPNRPEEGLALGLSDDLWETIQQCWVGDPAKRPNASNLVQRLSMAIPGHDHTRRISQRSHPSAQVSDDRYVRFSIASSVSPMQDNGTLMKKIDSAPETTAKEHHSLNPNLGGPHEKPRDERSVILNDPDGVPPRRNSQSVVKRTSQYTVHAEESTQACCCLIQ